MFFVICRGDTLPDGTPGAYELATRRHFDRASEAEQYAQGIAQGRAALVLKRHQPVTSRLHRWETLTTDTERMAVPGGWIYRTIETQSLPAFATPVALTFVPAYVTTPFAWLKSDDNPERED